MEMLGNIQDMIGQQIAAWPGLEERGRHVIDLVRSHPWITLGVATGTVYIWSCVKSLTRNLPPGPFNYPVVGAVSCLSEEMPQKMLEWRPLYGEIVYCRILGQETIILNSDRIIRETLVKRPDEFSHRVKFPLLDSVTGDGDEVFSAPYDEKWKNNKKFAITTLKNFGFGTAKGEERIQEQLDYLEQFLLKSNGSPITFNDELQLISASIVAAIVLGDCRSWDDPDTAKLVAVVHEWYQAMLDFFMKGGFFFDTYSPFLGKFFCRKLLKDFKTTQDAMHDYLINKFVEHTKDFAERESEDVIDAYLKKKGTTPEALKMMAFNISVFLPDAIDTTGLLDRWMLFYLCYFPEFQQKIHEELDRVCGQDRRVGFDDRQALHQINAVLHETLRHCNLVPRLMPRELREDVKLEGYTLPKGAHVVGNLYAVHYDPEVFPNPNKFDPSRFINDDGTFSTSLASKLMTFSIGSRKCMGESFMKVHSFMFLARVLQRFTLEFDPDAPKPSMNPTKSLLKEPEPFKVCFKPK